MDDRERRAPEYTEPVGGREPCGPADEAERLVRHAPELVAVVPIEDRGRHELLRLAAALAAHLPGRYAAALVAAAGALGIQPARVEEVLSTAEDRGIVARIEGRTVALGRQDYLAELGVQPRLAEQHAAERVEVGRTAAWFVVALEGAHCLGILGVKEPGPMASPE
jgi:cation transport ATPase